jgi:hypothetical protein
MEKYYSAIDGQLNHIILTLSDLSELSSNRVNVCPDESFLQLGLIKSGPRSYAPHFHLDHQTPRQIIRAQESWVVMRGSVEVTLYDKDDSVQATKTLNQGDVTLTLYGGHGYKILEEGTLVYEFKSGPYEGIEIDKQEIVF